MVKLSKDVVLDFNEHPHLLIAGETGSGKSVTLHQIITQLMEDPTSEFILIDPKRVELAMYKKIEQLYCPIAIGSENASGALSRAVQEMEWRYQEMERMEINKAGSHFSNLYVIVDELADLMFTNRKDTETKLVRIAQLGRAANVHLIVATQRPSKEVVTGLLKCNLPTRIALATASQVDSRVIIDHTGCEQLRGKGDAIFKHGLIEKRFQVDYIDMETVMSIAAKHRAIERTAPVYTPVATVQDDSPSADALFNVAFIVFAIIALLL